ncbi:MAG: hypothetical protein J1E62_07525 [Lachnospiraceae bacterium]|nr:hypothetical protein [Lachnospiraceae bacterium]
MFQNQKVIPLPEKLRRNRRTFWMLYLGTLIGIPALTFFICFSIMGWEGMVRDIGKPRPQDIYMLFQILFIYSIPFFCFYLGMRNSHKACLEKYDSMLSEERRQLDRQFQRPIQMGEVIYTQRHFLHRDKYRLFFYYIHSYEEIIWAYQAQSLYQMNQMEALPVPVFAPSDLRFHTIVLVTKDGKKYAVFMGNWNQMVPHMSRNTILGYGKEQKRQAKERRHRD